MKIRLFAQVFVVVCFVLCSNGKGAAQDSVGIRGKKVVVRHNDKNKPMPSDTIIRYPLLSGLSNKALLQRLQRALMPQGVYKGSLEEMRKDSWLEEVTYKVNCNQHAILDVSYTLSGMAAYPDSFDEHITLNLKTGKPIKASNLFIASELPKLIIKVNRAMQTDIQQAIKKVDKEYQADIKQQLTGARFQADDLKAFTVSSKGVTFYHNFGFPHVIKAAEPEGRYFFPYASLKPFVRRDGLLSSFLR